MKTLLITLTFLAALSLKAQIPQGYTLKWSDEFNGTQVDTSNWTFEIGDHGWGNNELQYYTAGENAIVADGVLKIIAKKENGRYTSTRMVTRDKKIFTYGYFEIRAKLPQGTGTWPAIWMLGNNIKTVGWPACGEIDIMEHVGKNPRQVHTTIHNSSGYGNTPYTSFIKLDDPFNEFHNYSIDWTADHITFLIDGKEIYTYKQDVHTPENWPFDLPQFFILNIAVGGNWGGPDVDDAIFPQTMTVDYVRVYQK